MRTKSVLIVGLFLCISLPGAYFLSVNRAPVFHNNVHIDGLGDVMTAQPAWGVKASSRIFADTAKFSPVALAQQFAAMGVATAIIDTTDFFKPFRSPGDQCLGPEKLAGFIKTIDQKIPAAAGDTVFISGIGDGALLPLINALNEPDSQQINLSSGFSAELPADLRLCPPLATATKGNQQTLISAPGIKAKWRSVWNEKPAGKTAIFIKEKTPHADTEIAAYNTPLDTLLLSESQMLLGQGADAPPIPVIEIPAETKNGTVTLFYSGDGGWRDLDRSVAEEMAKQDHSVLGVDVLRYFWERKTPEQVSADLAATMRYYRTHWDVKSFVLAGFSFGADILPVIYNKLPEAEKNNVAMLVFLALGNHADFEVHVAGWLGQETHEMALPPELGKIPGNKILCVYGKEEKAKTGTACASLASSETTIIELPGGHHFDKDYPKLARLILESYRNHGIN
jgi:hypothetical protein